ncbi:MAG: hypothetical protein DMF68_13760 [Acidobacteria bacterium]|nr:MAG: hypothetical protein DMF68_13760 [Acidobacteriota bacterium]
MAINQVTSNLKPAFHTRHALSARLLAFVLLLLVAYTTTAEAVHKHGNLSVNRTATIETVASRPSDTSSSLDDSDSIAGCLICQLHQNLSTTLFNPQPQVIAPQEQTTHAPAVAISYLSQTDTPRRGRAPPFTSLV